MASSFNRLKELDLSRDEVNRLGEALKKEEFRKLLSDYVEEIQDPKNRQIYEQEVIQIERERGQEVTFLHPTPGYVIKTSVNGKQKAFINICGNENINKPSSSASVKDGSKGLEWSVPHSLSPPREDLDNKGVRCQVYDVLFHPDTLHLTSKNRDFCSMVNNIALSAVESNFNVNLDKKNLKFPKLAYKGLQHVSIMRKPTQDAPVEHTAEEQQLFDKIYAEIDSQKISPQKKKKTKTSKHKEEDPDYTTPKYVIKHRSHIDIQDFTNSRNAKQDQNVPKELVLEVYLPLLRSSSDMQLDVTEKTVQLISEKPAKYKLNLTLPFQVLENKGNAKFDKELKKLVITLPVKRKVLFEVIRDDSGVESCVESDLNSPTNFESDDDKAISKKPHCDTDKSKHCDQVTDTFLDSNELYSLPDFTFNIFDNVIAFTFHVKKVTESSVIKTILLEKSLVKIKFTAVSSSFFPANYAFFVKFHSHLINNEEEVNVETWDNNVILQIPLKASEKSLESFHYGISEDNLTEKFIEEPAVLVNNLLQSKSENDNLPEPVEIPKSDVETHLPKHPKIIDLKATSSAIDILTSSYESSGDELSASSFSPRKGKGILKRISTARSKFGRSVSESSLDDFVCSSLENYHGSIDCVPEDARESDEISSSFKKTVRFNDVVVRQLFR